MKGKPYEEFLIVVGYTCQKKGSTKENPDPDRWILRSRVSADMVVEPPDPPLTFKEMQPVCYAAKMALCKVLRARAKAKRDGPQVCPTCGEVLDSLTSRGDVCLICGPAKGGGK